MKNSIQLILIGILGLGGFSLQGQNVKPIDTLRMELQGIINNATATYGMEGIELSVIFDDNWGAETFYAGIRAPGIAVDTAKPWHYAQAAAGYLNYVALKLIDEGQMSMDDSIGTHLDAAAMGLDGSITIRQLIRHTSVLNEIWVPGSSACYNDIWNQNPTVVGCPQDLLACFPADKANAGTFDYNNTNLLVLQFVVDSVTGHGYETEIQNRIFSPFGMNASYLSSCKTVTIDSINGIWTTASGYANNRSYIRYFSTNGGNRALIGKSYEVAEFYRALFNNQLLSATVMDSVKTIIPGSDIPQGSYGCAADIRGYVGYNTDIVRVITNSGDTAWMYGKGGFGMNGHLTLHMPARNVTISFVHNDRSRQLQHRNLALDLFCYLYAVDSVATSSVGLAQWDAKDWSLYPNPAGDFIQLDFAPGLVPKALRLMDLNGRVMLTQDAGSPSRMDLRSVAKGLYFVEVELEGYCLRKRVVIE